MFKKFIEEILCYIGFHDKHFVEHLWWLGNKDLYICNRCYLQWIEEGIEIL